MFVFSKVVLLGFDYFLATDLCLGKTYSVVVSIEYGIEDLHEGISNNEEILLSLLLDIECLEGVDAD